MQRLIARIKDEFSTSKILAVEIKVLNGSGDYLVIYTGSIKDITDLSIKKYFQLPGCFYFLKILSASPAAPLPRNEAIVSYQRDLCWLSEPLPPKIDEIDQGSFLISWPPAKFCGFKPYSVTDSLIYTIEIKEGVSWKEGYICQHVNDVNHNAYKRIFSTKDDFEFQINDLKSACWYHIRLEIEYLGIKVYSDVQSAHTSRGVPSTPNIPRITIIPVMSSFDISSRIPVRFDILITWGSSLSNGSDIASYQVQMKTFDKAGHAKAAELKRSKASLEHERSSAKDVIAHIISTKKNYNQWIRSNGRNVKQIETCLRHRSPSKLPNIANDSSTTGLQEFPSLFSTLEDVLESPERQSSPPVLRSTGWMTIYNNLPRRLKIDPPQKDDFAWNIRVRARNAEGWSAYSDVLIVDGFTHPSLFRLPASSLSLLSNAAQIQGDRRRPVSSPTKILRPPTEIDAPLSVEKTREGGEDNSAVEVDNVGVDVLIPPPLTERKPEVSVSKPAPGLSEEIATSKSVLKSQIEELKKALLKPKTSVEPTLRSKKSIIHFPPHLEQEKGNAVEVGERSVHTTSSKSTSRKREDLNQRRSLKDAHGDTNDTAKDLFAINRRNKNLKSNLSFHRASSAGAISSNVSKGTKDIVINTAAASHSEVVPQRNNLVLEILMPFKDWR